MESNYYIPSFVDVIRRPAIEVNDTYFQTPDIYVLAEKLNVLFKQHVDSQHWVAEVKYAKEFQCKMCGNVCEVFLDDVTKNRTCSVCGKGKVEYSIKVLAESEGASLNDNILQK